MYAHPAGKGVIVNIAEHIPNVFEGEVIASHPVDTIGQKIQISHKIRITRVFRGNLRPGTIELLSRVVWYKPRADGLIKMPGSPLWTPVNGVYRVSELKERTDADPKWTEFDDNYIGTNTAFIFEYLNTNPTNLNHDYEVTAGGHHIGGV